MKKVTISQRSVYHKFAQLEIEIPESVNSQEELHTYMLSIENEWVSKIDHKINEAEFVSGTGLYDIAGMEDGEADEEWRYDCKELDLGGHL
tara:strand:- start:130 stop:402 length:273 start_codon:yes stop_codon:yes gene_type:complete